MEKRVLLAVVLSFLVLYGYQALFPPPKPAGNPAGTATTPAAPEKSPPPPGGTTSAPAAAAPSGASAAAASPAQPAAAAIVADAAERDITFENESVRAVFTTRGGALKSWRLKKYQDANREPLELVPHMVPEGTL